MEIWENQLYIKISTIFTLVFFIPTETFEHPVAATVGTACNNGRHEYPLQDKKGFPSFFPPFA